MCGVPSGGLVRQRLSWRRMSWMPCLQGTWPGSLAPSGSMQSMGFVGCHPPLSAGAILRLCRSTGAVQMCALVYRTALEAGTCGLTDTTCLCIRHNPSVAEQGRRIPLQDVIPVPTFARTSNARGIVQRCPNDPACTIPASWTMADRGGLHVRWARPGGLHAVSSAGSAGLRPVPNTLRPGGATPV